MHYEIRGEQTWPRAHERRDAATFRPQHHGLVDHVPTHGMSSMPAERPRLVVRQQPPMPIVRRLERQHVLRTSAPTPNRCPSVMELVLIRERDDDVSPCHSAHLVEGLMDRV